MARGRLGADGLAREPDFTLAIVFGHAPRCGDRVALVALRGVVISIIRTIRYQVTQDGNTTPPGRRETRSRAADGGADSC